MLVRYTTPSLDRERSLEVCATAVSRSGAERHLLSGGNQPLPSVSSYTKQTVNADGSMDFTFSPSEPKEKGNWIQTVPSKVCSRSFPSTAPQKRTSTELEAQQHRAGELRRRNAILVETQVMDERRHNRGNANRHTSSWQSRGASPYG